MSKPVILAVDDDPNVLEAVVQDLRRRYASEYRVLRAGSGQAALDISAQLADRGDAVALYLSDQRMPGIAGVEFLEQAQKIYPEARRALLTAYADTEVAIRAINSARIHYYLTKPWDPPEQQLYPVIDDLLVTWKQSYHEPYEGLRVIGPRWSARDHEVRNFLSRNQVPYLWLDPERDGEAEQLMERHNLEGRQLPGMGKKGARMLKKFKPLPFTKLALIVDGQEVADLDDPEDTDVDVGDDEDQPSAYDATALTRALAELVRRLAPGALLHTDAVQAAAWLDVGEAARGAPWGGGAVARPGFPRPQGGAKAFQPA